MSIGHPMNWTTMEMDENEETTDVSTLCLNGTRATPITNKPQPAGRQNDNTDSGGWTPLLVLAGATCCLGSAVPAGFNIGVMNNPAHLMQTFCNQSSIERYNIHLSAEELKILWSTVVSIFLIGGVTGSLMTSWLSDKFGRKKTLGIGNICGIVGAAMFFLVPKLNSVELLLLGRLIVGLSGGIATSLLPMYMTEVAPLKLRGAVGVLCQLGITCGVLLGQIAGLDTVLGMPQTWHLMLASFSPLCALALLLTFALPESPKYLFIIKQQEERAVKALSRLRNTDIILLHNEIASLQKEAGMRTSDDIWTMKRILTDSTVKLPLFLLCLIQLGQQFSGINAVFYYSSSIFIGAGLDIVGSQYATIGTGLANIAMALISVPVMSFFNRRVTFLSSCYLCMGCLIVLCASIACMKVASFMPLVSIIAVLAYVTFYGIGLGPIPYFIGSELFDVGPRPAAMALGSVFNWGGNFIVGMVFPFLQDAIGPYTFLLFTGFIAILAQIVKIYLPETRGKTTSEVAKTMTQGFSSRPNACAS